MCDVPDKNKLITRLALFLSLALVVSCGNESSKTESNEESTPGLTAATLGEQRVLSNKEFLAGEPYASADRSRGQQQAQICRACHSLDEGGRNTIGPALYGFFGRQAGAVEGFVYSPVVQNADFVWTPRALDAWLAQPGKFLPGNLMTFAGVRDKADRDALIAYLLDVTDSE